MSRLSFSPRNLGTALGSAGSVLIGRAARTVTKLRGGGGSAFPGLVVEKLDPHFLARTLHRLPRGVIVVSGTNGKTTTTKMVVELLQGQGLKVFTNRSGSNFTRGVVASILEEVKLSGKLDADIAVLELDEAHAVHFVKAVRPNHSLLLNVMRDQLDRFGEIDTTAGMLRTIAQHTVEAVVLNREDPRVRAIAETLGAQRVDYFGLSESLRGHFPSDDDFHSGPATAADHPHADVVLEELIEGGGRFTVDGESVTTSLTVNGAYNTFNAAAAMAVVRQALGDTVDAPALIDSLSKVSPAFGRGESLTVQGRPLDLVLVKNPSGFRLGLSSFPAGGVATMIAINDNYADGRDMSWLWDVEFASLAEEGVRMISGVRAYDMALRLKYDEVDFDAVEPDLSLALTRFLEENPGKPARIFCTYTAMLGLRKRLGAYTEVEAF
ncbi:MurT ligase domain-containing protein [Nesterenkonia sp. LB17]|uniref:Mur ligase family protein n=1 Tax=unclassified Nesterenkonia TaxID=2629769 RepID=UPI001F4CCCFB|nr:MULTISPECIES: Mur ligase family protein [unclassified Nesterenkonia]MCH8560925.1 MurT ligase domain-containing protein [Nesterenkonia sp. DZ6]MCH8566115.1 MurT ligase domain-containing protein [Nesterenkonia sp. LB17]